VKLWARFTVLTMLGTLPVLVVMLAIYPRWIARDFDTRLSTALRAQLPAAGVAACPEHLTRPLPRTDIPQLFTRRQWSGTVRAGLEVTIFSRDGQALVAGAAPLSSDELAALRADGGTSSAAVSVDGGPGRQWLVEQPLAPPGCSLARGVASGSLPRFPPAPLLLAPLLFAALATATATALVTRRVRALALAMHRWQADPTQLPPASSNRDELGELASMIHDTAQTVTEQQAQLVGQAGQQREFMENVLHDVATPLSVLQGHLSALTHNNDTDLLRRAMNETQYIVALLEGLALSARVNGTSPETVRIEFRDLVERVAERHAGMAVRLGIGLERAVPGAPVPVWCDPTLAEQALTNLVTNALRHGHEGGHVAIVLDIDGESFTLRVLDDGPGLRADELSRVVLRGERATTTASGSGLGLAIVQDVARRYGWRFTLTSAEPTGLVAEIRGTLASP
jgi:signal transduction histidine kinase